MESSDFNAKDDDEYEVLSDAKIMLNALDNFTRIDTKNFKHYASNDNVSVYEDFVSGNIEKMEDDKSLRLSGKEWVNEYKERENQSEDMLLNDLDIDFKQKVVSFIKVLREAGANVIITATKRSKKRAVLMHYAWRISVSRDITPQQAQQETKKANIPINWLHKDSNGDYSETISRQKALEMKNAYNMSDVASITSNHIAGKAIDMTITWTKNIKIRDNTGKEYVLAPNNGGKCKELHNIGATYGVYKLVKNPPDYPHWSFNGK